jgi:hypothetical protein
MAAAPGEGWRVSFGYFFLVLMLVVIFGSVALVWWRRGRFPLKSSGRSALLNTISALASLCLLWYPVEEIRGTATMATDSRPCTAFFFLITLFAPVFALPLLAGYLRYYREWKIYAKMQELLTAQKDQHASNSSAAKNEVARMRAQISLRAALLQVSLGLLLCLAISLALYYAHASSRVVQEADGGGVMCLLEAGTRAYEASTIFGACAAIVAMHVATRRHVRDDVFGIRREYKVMVVGVTFWLALWGICWLVYPNGVAGFQPGYLQCCAVLHVLGSLLIWPSLRTFRGAVLKTRPRAGEHRELQMPRSQARKLAQSVLSRGGGGGAAVAHGLRVSLKRVLQAHAVPPVAGRGAGGGGEAGAGQQGAERLAWSVVPAVEVEAAARGAPEGAAGAATGAAAPLKAAGEGGGSQGADSSSGGGAAAAAAPGEAAAAAASPAAGDDAGEAAPPPARARKAVSSVGSGSHRPGPSLSDQSVRDLLALAGEGPAEGVEDGEGRGQTLVSVLVEPRLTNDAGLHALLQDEAGFAAFRKQLEREFSLENIIFWKECEALLEQEFDGCDTGTLPMEVAKHVYETYCMAASPLQVNISSQEVRAPASSECGEPRLSRRVESAPPPAPRPPCPAATG